MSSVSHPRKSKICAIKKHLSLFFACTLSMQVGADESSEVNNSMPAVDCVINPYRVADIASPVAGIIEKLHVERSQQVSAGQVVAELDAYVERANVELARFRANVKSEIGLGEVNMSFDSRRKARVETLAEKQSISDENADQVEREARLSKWKLKQAKELSDIRKLELKRAEQQLQQKIIKAPFDGYVLDTYKFSGEYVEDQAILRLAQLNPLVIEAIVPMESFGQIWPGMQADIKPEILSDETITGTVTIVDRIGDTASNTFGVKLEMPNPENRIPAGLKCVVKFLEQTAEQKRAWNERQANSQVIAITTSADTNAMAMITEKSDAQLELPQPDLTEQPPLDEQAIPDPVSVDVSTMEDPIDEEVQTTELDSSESASYLVMINQGETHQQTRDIIQQLREAGIEDLQEMDHGPYKGKILLGLYNYLDVAEKRHAALEALGFNPSIEQRSAEMSESHTQQSVNSAAETGVKIFLQEAQLKPLQIEEPSVELAAVEVASIKPVVRDQGLAKKSIVSKPSSYLVLMEQGETEQITRDYIAQLREAGINDLHQMNYGPYKGYIMLGLYSSRGAAQKRQGLLESLGFITSVRERFAKVPSKNGDVKESLQQTDMQDNASVYAVEEDITAEENIDSEAEIIDKREVEEADKAAITSKPITYLVLTEQGDSEEQTQDIIKLLRESGIYDLRAMNHGPYQGQIMLGLYSTREAAQKRKMALEELGFTTYISERY